MNYEPALEVVGFPSSSLPMLFPLRKSMVNISLLVV